ncbi:acetyl/propionyl/methylcrotonyl-CoA carboxylase subunit alpha [Pedococcus sp. P5_B7]
MTLTTALPSVLIANRGEIALRVIRTARRLGVRTIALYTDLDVDAPHVRAADSAVHVRSYLDVDAVVGAAQSSGAAAVHPGYGFLSERAAFANALEAAGIRLVGPTALVMEQMGRKDAARDVAVAAGVPVIPAHAAADDPESFSYPVLVKAAAGGGGKGMRVVGAASDFAESLAAAKREAMSSFGDDTILIERYVESGRHIEVQVMGDEHGTVLHLWERDCSTQRRHQKVLEEAPAPSITEETRQALTGAAVRLAAAVQYTGAGTVEFLLDSETQEFFFLEMNTRLQVEHPVTEAITGLDLVELQFLVAAGQPLPLSQEQVTRSGHAIEARVYAEDSYNGFLPQAGRATSVRWPSPPAIGETTLRVDHALFSGQTVPTAYDPMLGKVIVHGSDREAARRGLLAALDDTAILGLTTNAGFLRGLVAHDAFRDALIDTAWLDDSAKSQLALTAPDSGPARRQAAWALHQSERRRVGAFHADGFRMAGAPARIVVELDEQVELVGRPPASVAAVITPDQIELAWQGQRYVFERPDPARANGAVPGDGSVLAPMPGTVLDVRVAVGDVVVEGQVLGVMEAMKMELTLKAPLPGTVAVTDAQVGDQVPLGAMLFEIHPVDPPNESA